MSTLRSMCIVGVVVPVMSGCAFSPVSKPDATLYQTAVTLEQSIPGTAADGMSLAKASLEALGYEVMAVTPELGQVRTKVKAVPVPETCDCGKWNGSVVRGSGNSAVVVNVTQSAGVANLKLEHDCSTTFMGRNLYGGVTRQETYQCPSKGSVEKDFFSTLQRVQQARFQVSSTQDVSGADGKGK